LHGHITPIKVFSVPEQFFKSPALLTIFKP